MDSTNFSYPPQFVRGRRDVNILIRAWLPKVLADSTLADMLLPCLLPGRKIRPLFCLAAAGVYQSIPEPLERLAVAIELMHASSVLVDDIIDCDCYRHGDFASQAVWGRNRSLLTAHLLTSAAFALLTPLPEALDKLLRVYHDMCIGELHDTMILPLDKNSSWQRSGYTYLVGQKTSRLFGFALWSGTYPTRPNDAQSMEQLGSAMGTLYQLTNDYYDWQPDNQHKRHRTDDDWPITFGFPLATFIRLHGAADLSPWLSRDSLSFEEWQAFLHRIWSDDCRRSCSSEIDRVQRDIQKMLTTPLVTKELKDLIEAFVSAATTRDFWYHGYNDTD